MAVRRGHDFNCTRKTVRLRQAHSDTAAAIRTARWILDQSTERDEYAEIDHAHEQTHSDTLEKTLPPALKHNS